MSKSLQNMKDYESLVQVEYNADCSTWISTTSDRFWYHLLPTEPTHLATWRFTLVSRMSEMKLIWVLERWNRRARFSGPSRVSDAIEQLATALINGESSVIHQNCQLHHQTSPASFLCLCSSWLILTFQILPAIFLSSARWPLWASRKRLPELSWTSTPVYLRRIWLRQSEPSYPGSKGPRPSCQQGKVLNPSKVWPGIKQKYPD